MHQLYLKIFCQETCMHPFRKRAWWHAFILPGETLKRPVVRGILAIFSPHKVRGVDLRYLLFLKTSSLSNLCWLATLFHWKTERKGGGSWNVGNPMNWWCLFWLFHGKRTMAYYKLKKAEFEHYLRKKYL